MAKADDMRTTVASTADVTLICSILGADKTTCEIPAGHAWHAISWLQSSARTATYLRHRIAWKLLQHELRPPRLG